MIGKRAWLTIPTLLLPYCTLFTLATIFLSTKTSFFKFVMESVFGGSAIYLFLALFIYCLLAAVLSAVYFIDSIYKKRDALFLAKYFMIVKLIQVPGYVLIFVLGVLCAITILTIPFSIALFFIDCFSLLLSGLGIASAVIRAIQQEIFKPKEILWVPITQLFFCIDVVAAIIFYVILKNPKAVVRKQPLI